MRFGALIDGSKIKAAREATGMSQAALARAIRSTEKNISRWENGQNQPRVSSIALIAKATGHDIDFFLTATEDGDDEEEAAMSSLDDYLRFRVRQIAREEIKRVFTEELRQL